jgi:hypothetical protein
MRRPFTMGYNPTLEMFPKTERVSNTLKNDLRILIRPLVHWLERRRAR